MPPETEQLVDEKVVVPTEAEETMLSDTGKDALADKIGQAFAKAQGDDVDEPAGELDEGTTADDDAAEVDQTPAEEEPEATDDDATNEPAPEEAAAAEGDPAEPTLPEVYRRSLKADNWTDAEIDEFYHANSEIAIRTAQRIHSTRNATTAEFARIGRLQQQQAPAAPAPAPEPAVPLAAPVQSGFTPIDEEALIAQYGSEDLVRGLVGPVNAALRTIREVMPELNAGVEDIRQSQQATLQRQTETFFLADEQKPYTAVYGTMEVGLTAEQEANRAKMLECADAVRAGAFNQGRDMTVDEALEMAHGYVSSDFKEAAIRKDMKQKVRKRAAGTTLKPNTRQRQETSSPSTTDREREARVRDGLNRALGSAE